MNKRYVIATSKLWIPDMVDKLTDRLGTEFIHITKKEELNYQHLKELAPRYIFFPHWSYMIPREIYNNFECVVFHMTDLPFGRGGSPLQNLLTRGIHQTMLSAIRVVEKLDAGDIYFKRDLSLYGSAEEIYIRTTEIVMDLIDLFVRTEPSPVAQSGEVVEFVRRRPEEGDIAGFDSLEKVFTYIRMLDADGYSNAFFETEDLRFEFARASIKKNCVLADVRITRKGQDRS